MKEGGKSSMRRTAIAFAASLVMLFAAVSPAHAQDEEHELIAVFIVNFLNFAVWHDSIAGSEQRVCVFGNDRIMEVINYVITKKNLRVKVSKLHSGDRVDGCSILYISKNGGSEAEALLQMTHKNPVLTASDIAGFASNGGIIEFMKSNNKMKLRINVREYKSRNLKLDPRMLQLAELVDS